jgi:hypothetical protein
MLSAWLLSLLLPTTTAAPPSTPSDAYLWQRRGNAPAVAAFASSLGGGTLRVLAAEAGPRPYRRGKDDVVRAVKNAHVDVVVVVRVDAASDDAAALALAVVDDFAGARVRGVEVDFDCGTEKLADYARFLRGLRARLQQKQKGLRLGITALPTWLNSSDVDAVVDAVDDVTLQVHSIKAPALLDVDDARAAVALAQARWPRVSIALPTYAATLANGAPIFAHVDDVAAVAADVRHIAWFRMPAAADVTAWSLATVRAVDARPAGQAGQAGLAGDVRVVVMPPVDPAPGSRVDVMLKNVGAVDVAGACVVVAGAAAYDAVAPFVRRGDGALCPDQGRFYAPGETLLVGWARPAPAAPDALRAHLAPR